ncbi:CRISPR-associated protein Cas5 [Larkinella sp. VNQ87]|uniref:CRISPR-associated protein Cas5 n=1 Tax=Larkinella sp. VNQ87 TaxID=3400921 RepID=UPI003C0749D6
MRYCVVDILTLTASFRNPDFQNFHKSLPLPPPTTLIGLAGAALGLSPKAAQTYFEGRNFRLGVFGQSEGMATDLWKYNTFDGLGSIVLRELLYDSHFLIAFGTDDFACIAELQAAFLNPIYCLTMGNSDSLAKIVGVTIISETSQNNQVVNCLVAGDVVADVLENVNSSTLSFSIYTTSDPIAFDLPTRFTYDSDYGARQVVRRQKLSFIGEQMQLNYRVEGIQIGEIFVPVFDLKM